MTAEVMDKVLERFKVVQYDPKGEKFDAKLHEDCNNGHSTQQCSTQAPVSHNNNLS